MWSPKDGRARLEHCLVWEAVHGPIPKGMHVHHKNGDRIDNAIENLELLTPLEHAREHSGCKLIGEVWWKPCRTCAETKPVTAFYRFKRQFDFECKECRKARTRKDTQARRLTGTKAVPRRGSSEPSSD